MKINEVFEGLIKNPKNVYEIYPNTMDRRTRLSLDRDGYFYLEIFNEKEELIPTSKGGGCFNGNINYEGDWELVREPVDFITAVRSRKRIKTEGVIDFHPAEWYQDCIGLDDINGKWFIEGE